MDLRNRLRSGICLLALLGVALDAAAQQVRTTDSILGISIASTAEEITGKLARLGSVSRRATRDGGQKESWTLIGTRFSHIAIRLDRAGRVMWITAFVREGEEFPFSELADPAQAVSFSSKRAAWTGRTAAGGYRLVVTGSDRKARAVSLFSSDVKQDD